MVVFHSKLLVYQRGSKTGGKGLRKKRPNVVSWAVSWAFGSETWLGGCGGNPPIFRPNIHLQSCDGSEVPQDAQWIQNHNFVAVMWF